jgi:hypothetical protein
MPKFGKTQRGGLGGAVIRWEQTEQESQWKSSKTEPGHAEEDGNIQAGRKCNVWNEIKKEQVKAKAVPLRATEAPGGGERSIAPTHSRPRH